MTLEYFWHSKDLLKVQNIHVLLWKLERYHRTRDCSSRKVLSKRIPGSLMPRWCCDDSCTSVHFLRTLLDTCVFIDPSYLYISNRELGKANLDESHLNARCSLSSKLVTNAIYKLSPAVFTISEFYSGMFDCTPFGIVQPIWCSTMEFRAEF